MQWEVEFYKDKNSHEPLKEFLDDLPAAARAKVVRLLALLAEQCVLVKSPILGRSGTRSGS
ncbi:MAG: hypothetical protein HZB31_15855 [Nitrospirae bacterium]|nr:hypothetical protein [Nitrospirota bacterium]